MPSKFDFNVPAPNIGDVDVSKLLEAAKAQEKIIDNTEKINKQKITIKTDDKQLLKTVDNLNKLANVKPDFYLNDIKKNAKLSNLDEFRNNVENLYGNELPRLKNELMDLYSGGLIHPEQYEFFSGKIDELNNIEMKNKSIGFLDSFKNNLENDIKATEQFAKGAIEELYSNILGGQEGSSFIRNQYEKLSGLINTLNSKGAGSSIDFSDRMIQLQNYLTVLDKVDDMTYTFSSDELSGRYFKPGAFDDMRSSIEAIGMNATELEGILKQAFEPQAVENESQAILTLINNINQLKASVLEIKNVLQSISGSGNNTSQLLDDINKISQIFNAVEIGEEKFENPIQAIIQQLANLQQATNQLDFSRISESIGTLESTLSTLPEIMKTALMSINGLDINMNGFDKSQEQLASEIRLLNAYEQIYTKLISSSDTDISSKARLTQRHSIFNIDEYESTLEKIAAYESQLDLFNKRIATNSKYNKITNAGNVGSDWAKNLKSQSMTWQDFIDQNLIKELRGAKQSRGLRRNQDVRKQQEFIESMTAANIKSDKIEGNITGDVKGQFNLKDAEEFSKLLTLITQQLDYISQVLTLINNTIVDGFNFQNSESQLDLLTNKIKELENELLKIKQESNEAFNTSEVGEQYTAQIESAEKLAEAEEKVAEASKKAKEVISENKTDTGATATAESIGSEAKAMQEAGDAARAAAEGKEKFTNANQRLANSANSGGMSAEKEADAIHRVGEETKYVLDRETTYQDKNRDKTGSKEVWSRKRKNKYETVKETYGKEFDEEGNFTGEFELKSVEIIEDYKKIKTEQTSARKKIAQAQEKLNSWLKTIDNQTAGKSKYISGYNELKGLNINNIDDIDKALNKMESVQGTVKEIQKEFTKGNTSTLNPWANANIAEESLDTIVAGLERDASKLKQVSPEIANAINEIKEDLSAFRQMHLDGDNATPITDYAKAYGDLSLKIRRAKTSIKDEKIFEATNKVYDPYTELEGQIKRYETLAKRTTKTNLEGKTATDAYKKDIAEMESVLQRIAELELEIRSRPFFDENKIDAAATKMSSIQTTLEDIARQHELVGTKTSDMAKMTSDQFNNNAKKFEQMARGWLKGENLTPLDDSVTVNFSNGIAKISAQVRGLDGNWRKFTADIDAAGDKLLNIKTPFANTKESARFSSAEAMSKAQKFTVDSFTKQYSSIAKNFGEYLSQSGFQFLGETPSIQLLENGLAKVSAKIKDAQGNWHNFVATVDASGSQIGNAVLKPITNNIENLERQLAGGLLPSDFTNQAIASYEKLFSKIKEGQIGYQEIIQEAQMFQSVASNVTTQESLDSFNQKLAETEEKYKRLNQLAGMTGKNSQLIMDGNNARQFETIEDAVKYAREYAVSMGKIRNITGQMTSDVIAKDGMGKFTIQIKNAQGEIKNLKFAYDDMQKSMVSNASTGGIERTGLLGYLDRVQYKLQNLTAYWTATLLNPYMLVGRLKEVVNVVVQLDDALVDLRKTTTMNSSDLNSFYFDANESAKKLGVTTSEIIAQAAEWSRLGYSDKESATRMAELSSQFASISPGMDVGTATEGLVSAMKAFDVQTDDVKDGIMSKINAVGNAFAETNANIITGLEKSSAAMAAANNSMDETVALFTAGQEIVQNAQTVGSSLRTIAMRIRGKFIVPIYCENSSLCYAL